MLKTQTRTPARKGERGRERRSLGKGRTPNEAADRRQPKRRRTPSLETNRAEDYAYVVENDEPTFVLVPVEEYERLVESDLIRSAVRNLKNTDDPNVKWIDAHQLGRELVVERIVAARKAAGLTQKQLGAKLGLPQSQISRIERNPDHTTVRTLKRIARALRVDVSALV